MRHAAALADSVPVPKHKVDGMTPEQMATIIRAFDRHELEALVRIAAATGCRQGELLGLKWSDVNVDVDARTLKVERTWQRGQFEEPKSSRSTRTIDLSDDDIEVLVRHRQRQVVANIDGLIFHRPDGKPYNGTTVTKAYQAALKRAGLPQSRFHDLRHGHATLLLAAGVPVHVVSERLGHADERITLTVYSHVIPKQRRDAADRFADMLRAASGG